MNELKRMIIGSSLYQKLNNAGKSIEMDVVSIEEGMERAAEELGCELYDLEYDIIEEGSEGLFGIGKKPYKIVFRYASSKIEGLDSDGGFEEDFSFSGGGSGGPAKIEPKNKDSEAIVKVTRDGVMLMVTPSKGTGKPIEDPLVVQQMLLSKEIFEYDVDMANKVVKEARGEFVKIADWMPNIYNDGKVTVDTSDDEMRAFVTVIPPIKNGREMDERDVFDVLENNSIVAGVKHDMVREIINRGLTNRPILVAEGTATKNGANARIDYKVNIDKENMPQLQDEDANVDFRELNLIENVQLGQVLAEKIPATDGVPGKTVKGGFVEAKDGRDVDITTIIGTNVELSEDGMKVTSKINGQVVYRGGKLSVEEIYEVKGDVGPETGNITFLGTVVVSGSVLDNYKIDAAGNIDIKGSVGKCILEAKGDIYVKLGVNGKLETKDRDGEPNLRVTQDGILLRVLPARGKGKPLTDTYSVENMLEQKEIKEYDIDLVTRLVKEAKGKYVKIAHAPGVNSDEEGVMPIGTEIESDSHEIEETHIKAGNDIVAKFIQYANVDAERDVVVTESIMSSYINAERRVILVGKRASIVGGRVRALTEVNGKTIGTSSGTKTVIEVGMAPSDRQRLEELGVEKLIVEEDIPKVTVRIKEAERVSNLDEERQHALEKDKKRLEYLQGRIQEISKEMEDISNAVMSYNIDAKISAAKMIYPGVVPVVKLASFPGDGAVRDNFKTVTLFAEGDTIQIDAYQGVPQQVKKAAL